MADTPPAVSTAENLLQLTKLVAEHSHLLFALMTYVSEQPSFDAIRFGAILEHQKRARLNPASASDQAEISQKLLDFLKRFEGPVQ